MPSRAVFTNWIIHLVRSSFSLYISLRLRCVFCLPPPLPYHLPLLPSLSFPLQCICTELLYDIFNILYDDLEMVDEHTFIEWRDKGREGKGKGNAVHSLTDFFQWLENAHQESDPEL